MESLGYLANRIREEIKLRGLNQSSFTSLIYNELGLKEITARTYINELCRGYAVMSIGLTEKSRPIRLARLSFVLSRLDIKEDDELISKIKEQYKDFIYPPKNPIKSHKKLSGLELKLSLLEPDDKLLIEKLMDKIISSYKTQ